MDMIPRNNYGERCQFDAYCKLVLYHEAIDYLREMQRCRDRERASEQHQTAKQAWRLAGDDARAGSKILAH